MSDFSGSPMSDSDIKSLAEKHGVDQDKLQTLLNTGFTIESSLKLLKKHNTPMARTSDSERASQPVMYRGEKYDSVISLCKRLNVHPTAVTTLQRQGMDLSEAVAYLVNNGNYPFKEKKSSYIATMESFFGRKIEPGMVIPYDTLKSAYEVMANEDVKAMQSGLEPGTETTLSLKDVTEHFTDEVMQQMYRTIMASQHLIVSAPKITLATLIPLYQQWLARLFCRAEMLTVRDLRTLSGTTLDNLAQYKALKVRSQAAHLILDLTDITTDWQNNTELGEILRFRSASKSPVIVLLQRDLLSYTPILSTYAIESFKELSAKQFLGNTLRLYLAFTNIPSSYDKYCVITLANSKAEALALSIPVFDKVRRGYGHDCIEVHLYRREWVDQYNKSSHPVHGVMEDALSRTSAGVLRYFQQRYLFVP